MNSPFYKGCLINKLQNGIIQLIFKIWKILNLAFVRHLIGHIYWNFYEDDIIIVTSHVHRTQSVSRVFFPFFYHLPSLNTIASYEYQKNECVQQWNLFEYQTSMFYFLTYCPNLFLNSAISASVAKTTHWAGLFSSTTFSPPQANFLHQIYIAGLVKHLSPYTRRDLRVNGIWAKFFYPQKNE